MLLFPPTFDIQAEAKLLESSKGGQERLAAAQEESASLRAAIDELDASVRELKVVALNQAAEGAAGAREGEVAVKMIGDQRDAHNRLTQAVGAVQSMAQGTGQKNAWLIIVKIQEHPSRSSWRRNPETILRPTALATVAAAERALKAASSNAAALAARQVEVAQEAEREQVPLPRMGRAATPLSAMEEDGEEAADSPAAGDGGVGSWLVSPSRTG